MNHSYRGDEETLATLTETPGVRCGARSVTDARASVQRKFCTTQVSRVQRSAAQLTTARKVA